MPWPKEHKRNTRVRIVEAAAEEFRRHGIAQVGVAEVMRHAGLTHGGFYAHFDSKEDLLAEAIGYASEQVNSMLDTSPEDDASARHLLEVAMTYLSSFHLTHPERACPVATLGPELLRGSQKVRRTLAAEIRRRLKKLHDLTSAQLPPEARRQQAAGTFACMVGGLILARGLKLSGRHHEVFVEVQRAWRGRKIEVELSPSRFRMREARHERHSSREGRAETLSFL